MVLAILTIFVGCFDLSDFLAVLPDPETSAKGKSNENQALTSWHSFCLWKYSEASHGGVDSVMKQGDKIRISTTIRSHQTGLLLPREGIFIGAIENIGRTLLLVDFGKAGKQYIFDHEVETQREI